MSRRVRASLRTLVLRRARGLCEYCLIRDADTFFGLEVEHIIADQHGGLTTAGNLAAACLPCNRRKGTNIASISKRTGHLCRLFNPRTDRWAAHFELDGDFVRSKSDIGEVTIRILGLNEIERLLERKALRIAGCFPSMEAVSVIQDS